VGVPVDGVNPAGVAEIESAVAGNCVAVGCVAVSSFSGAFPAQDVSDTTAIKQIGRKSFLILK
jgi:hypothetical protein